MVLFNAETLSEQGPNEVPVRSLVGQKFKVRYGAVCGFGGNVEVDNRWWCDEVWLGWELKR